MKITYYGTAAAEGWPALFCGCDTCKKAAEKGGRNIRTRSQTLIDDGLLIDFPTDTYLHMLQYGLDLKKVHSLLVTHSHFDHYCPSEFWCRNEGIANDIHPDVPKMEIYGGRAAAEMFGKRGSLSAERVGFTEIEPYRTLQIGGYLVTPLEADHDKSASSMIYIIGNGEKTLLYAHDTGRFEEGVWKYITQNKIVFDFVSLDCTNGPLPYDRGHMGVEADRRMKARLLETGAARGDTVFCINHFSHNGGMDYDEMTAFVRDEFIVAYDGLSVEF